MERKTGSSKGWRSVNHQHGNYQEWESLPLNLYLLELPPKAGFLMSAHHIFSCVSIRYLWYWFLFSLSSSACKLSIAGFNIKLFFKTLVTAICNIQMLFLNKFVVVVVQSLKHVWHFVTPWTAAHRASLSFTIWRVCSIAYPLSQWCHPNISSAVFSFSSCLQSFSESGFFPMTQLLASGGQNTGASASVLPVNIQDWFPLGLTGLISLQSKGL